MRSDLTCPVEVERVQVGTGARAQENAQADEAAKKADQIICDIGFLCLVDREVDSVQMNIVCFDEQDRRLGGRLVRAAVQKEDGERRYAGAFMPEHVDGTVRVEASVEKVWFKDGVVWRREERNVREYTPNILPEGRELDRLRAVAGPDAMGYAREEDVLWMCVCGRANPIDEDTCFKCHRQRAQVVREYCYTAIDSTVGRRERDLERQTMDNLRRSSEQTVRSVTAEHKRLAKRRRNVRIVIALLVLVAVILAGLRWGVPLGAVKFGEHRLAENRAADAKKIFDWVDAYWPGQFGARALSDTAQTRIVEGLLAVNTALALEEAQSRADAIVSPEGKQLSERVTLARAALAEAEGDLDAAEALYSGMTGSEEAQTRLLALIYRIADEAQERLDYPTAIERFASLGEYEDAQERHESAIYLYGRQLLREGHYARAAEQFLLVSDTDDALSQARRSYYLLAQERQAAGEWVEAAELFESLGVYAQAEPLARACRYAAGMNALDAGELETAAAQLRLAAGHEDAAEQFEAAVYALSESAMEADDPKTAIEWLSQLDRTDESAAALQAATYALAQKQEAAGEKEQAALTYASLGDYEDAAERADALEYEVALSEISTQPETALMRFELLGGYKDAAQQAKRCRYLIAEAAFDAHEYQRAMEIYETLNGYEESETRLRRSRYALAGERFAAGEFEEAATLYEACGAYQDAEELALRARYEAAAALEDEGALSEAARAFAALGSYEDAPARARAAEDSWLSDVHMSARMDMELGDYESVIRALEDIWQQELPDRYADIPELYTRACLARADELIAQNRPLDALDALERIPNNEEALKRLEENVYGLIGTWQTATGARYVFRRDGSCNLDGQEAYYGGSGYSIYVGDMPYPTARVYEFVGLRGNVLTLRVSGTNSQLRLTYVGEPLDLVEAEDEEAGGKAQDAQDEDTDIEAGPEEDGAPREEAQELGGAEA